MFRCFTVITSLTPSSSSAAAGSGCTSSSFGHKKMHFLSLINDLLPLVIAKASHENENLHLSGKSWSFNSLSPWRITGSRGIVLSGSEFEDANAAVSSLCGHSIVGVTSQSQHHSGDPCFEMDDGRFLEVFSAHYLEPWVMHLPSGPVLVASPTDAGASGIKTTPSIFCLNTPAWTERTAQP